MHDPSETANARNPTSPPSTSSALQRTIGNRAVNALRYGPASRPDTGDAVQRKQLTPATAISSRWRVPSQRRNTRFDSAFSRGCPGHAHRGCIASIAGTEEPSYRRRGCPAGARTSSTAVPYRQEMEQLFGASFAEVATHLGEKEALARFGAGRQRGPRRSRLPARRPSVQ